MPYVFVGKRNYYLGKTLWEIVGNLRNFGEGRILVRSQFERYPEVSYFRIVKAEPLMDEKNLFGRVWAEKVFRGKPSENIMEISKISYKNDFKLVPKDEEQRYLDQTMPLEEAIKIVKKLPEFMEFPPLLKEMIQEKQNSSEEPLLKVVYAENLQFPFSLDEGKVTRLNLLDRTVAPRLYANIKQEK